MKILVDAFGGDYAPLEIIKGVSLAKSKLDNEICMVGNKQKILEVSTKNEVDVDGIEIFDCESYITNNDNPMEIIKSKSDSSMATGLKLLAQDKVDAFISAGNSGALLIGASLILKRAPGVRRMAFAPFVPKFDGGKVLFLDGGANSQCTAEILFQFAIMGSNYLRNMFKIENPKIGLLNIGTEPNKGDDLRKKVFKLLESSKLNFVGNVEARDVCFCDCDIIVTDGFSGNIFIKTFEGVAKFILSKIDNLISSNLRENFGEIKKMVSSSNYGGVPLLGASKLIIKAHGNSCASGIYKCCEKLNVSF